MVAYLIRIFSWLVLINRTVPLYSSSDNQGNPMANWAMDSLIETVQKYYHKMNFHTGKSNGRFKHSAHIMLMSKASRIVAEEYSKLRATEDRDAKFVDHDDHNLNTPKAIKNTKNLSIPRRERKIECCCGISLSFQDDQGKKR